MNRWSSGESGGVFAIDASGGQGALPLPLFRQELHQEPDRRPRRPGRISHSILFAPRHAGDVQVDPWGAVGELLQEISGGDRPRLRPADILQIPDVALDLLEVLLKKRKLPRPLPGDRKST